MRKIRIKVTVIFITIIQNMLLYYFYLSRLDVQYHQGKKLIHLLIFTLYVFFFLSFPDILKYDENETIVVFPPTVESRFGDMTILTYAIACMIVCQIRNVTKTFSHVHITFVHKSHSRFRTCFFSMSATCAYVCVCAQVCTVEVI